MKTDETALRQIVKSPLAADMVQMILDALARHRQGLTVFMEDGTTRHLAGLLETMRFLRERFDWRPQ